VCVVCVFVFKLSYLAYNAHVPYCHLRPAPFYSPIPHHVINGKIFEKKVTERKMCVLTSLWILYKIFLILKELTEIWSNMTSGLHVMYQLFLSDFNESWIVSIIFLNAQISNFMKIHLVGAELFHADKTDRHDEANSHFSKFWKRA
jgi:hypothetical protein